MLEPNRERSSYIKFSRRDGEIHVAPSSDPCTFDYCVHAPLVSRKKKTHELVEVKQFIERLDHAHMLLNKLEDSLQDLRNLCEGRRRARKV